MKDFKPVYNVQINELIKIASKSWPKGYFREILDIDVIKEFYNVSYQNFHNEIEMLLSQYHPASWIRIAYIQLELWTFELFEAHSKKQDLTTTPNLFIPIGRYGWRYILEISLERLENYSITQKDENRPDEEKMAKVFTLLVGLNYCNELSNYLHFFRDHFKTVKLVFSHSLYSKLPELDENGSSFLNNLITYMHSSVDYNLVPEFNYANNVELLRRIDKLLLKHYGFSLKNIEDVLESLREKIMPKIGAAILIIPMGELIDMLVKMIGLEVSKVAGVMKFIFFDVTNYKYEKRDFLKKSQNIRMLNYAGCKLKLTSNFKTIYDDKASEFNFVKASSQHCIISPLLLVEWRHNFITRLIFGQRVDLKEFNKDLKNDISSIELFFHRNIFENALKKILLVKGLPCISIEEVEKKKIVCGEIDAISVDVENKIIYIVEAKNLSPAKDARAFGKIISDHYKQKKYHKKFQNKILWVENNLDAISKIFNLQISEDFKIEKYFVTGSPGPLKFLIDEYNVLTYFEFFNLINKRYE
jgi:hypothetical protein